MSIHPSNKRIAWKGVDIGDYAYISFSYQGNNSVRIVPRGKGAIIRSTEEMGGGILTITLKGVKAENTRLALEQYFGDLDSSLSLNSPGSLVIDDSYTLTNCYLDSFSQDDQNLKSTTFTFTFTKSL